MPTDAVSELASNPKKKNHRTIDQNKVECPAAIACYWHNVQSTPAHMSPEAADTALHNHPRVSRMVHFFWNVSGSKIQATSEGRGSRYDAEWHRDSLFLPYLRQRFQFARLVKV